MKNKALMVSFVVLLAIFTTLSAVVAEDFVRIDDIKINDISVYMGGSSLNGIVAGNVGEKVPVEVYFTARKDVSDVRVKAYIEGFKNDISESTDRFHIINGSTYVKRFTMELPSAMDIEDLNARISLLVRISAQDEDSVEFYRDIEMQRDLYNIDFLSIESPDKVVAGSQFAIDVVIENNGNERLNDVYVKASIPELGITRNVYVGDIGQYQEGDELYYENIRNSHEKRIYLAIPKTANAGTYDIQLEAYNYDIATSAKKKIVVDSVSTTILPSTTSRTIAVDEEATFDVVLVNTNDRTVVYTITPEDAKGMIVEVSEPVTAVSADSSKTVKVKVTATNSAEEGAHLITINVNSEGGVAKQVSFNANVKNAASSKPSTITPGNNTVLILTVVLSIIFVVLLVVLIVLLTKKPAESEEFGETSYY